MELNNIYNIGDLVFTTRKNYKKIKCSCSRCHGVGKIEERYSNNNYAYICGECDGKGWEQLAIETEWIWTGERRILGIAIVGTTEKDRKLKYIFKTIEDEGRKDLMKRCEAVNSMPYEYVDEENVYESVKGLDSFLRSQPLLVEPYKEE